MRELARSTRALRLLVLAGGFVCAWFAMSLATAASVLAHTGHHHPADIQGAVNAPAVASIAQISPDSRAEAPVPDAVGSAGHGTILEGSRLTVTLTVDVARWPQSKSLTLCPCGGGCPSCTSSSCCGVAFVPELNTLPAQAKTPSRAPVIGTFTSGAVVAPLPRPPSLQLLA